MMIGERVSITIRLEYPHIQIHIKDASKINENNNENDSNLHDTVNMQTHHHTCQKGMKE